jgi:hypothetical protein
MCNSQPLHKTQKDSTELQDWSDDLNSFPLQNDQVVTGSRARAPLNSMIVKMLLEKVGDWQKKSRLEHDTFNRYASVFIAYNTFYNLYAETLDPNVDLSFGDSIRATSTLNLVSDKAKLFREMKSRIEEYAQVIPLFLEEYWPRSNSKDRVAIAETLKEALAEGDADKALEMVIRWLYKVRCNLMHGEKAYGDSDQERLLAMSSELLDTYLSKILRYYRELYLKDP